MASKTQSFSPEERAAMKERAKELKSAASRAEAEKDLLAKVAELGQPDRGLAERVHELITAAAPSLAPRLWYGMPAYAKDGQILCFFQAGEKFKTRYCTLGFNDVATLDDGTMFPTAWALTEMTPENEARITELVTRAVR